MTNRTKLDLWSNRLTGSILPQIGLCLKLQGVYIGNNHLQGSDSATLGGLSSLVKQDLTCNRLHGSFHCFELEAARPHGHQLQPVGISTPFESFQDVEFGSAVSSRKHDFGFSDRVLSQGCSNKGARIWLTLCFQCSNKRLFSRMSNLGNLIMVLGIVNNYSDEFDNLI
ncbi:Leucine-rich repeat receptor protein kinase EMS1 [Linum grandiflorum]